MTVYMVINISNCFNVRKTKKEGEFHCHIQEPKLDWFVENDFYVNTARK